MTKDAVLFHLRSGSQVWTPCGSVVGENRRYGVAGEKALSVVGEKNTNHTGNEYDKENEE